MSKRNFTKILNSPKGGLSTMNLPLSVKIGYGVDDTLKVEATSDDDRLNCRKLTKTLRRRETFSVTFRPTFRVRHIGSDGEVESEFNLALNDMSDRRKERTSNITAVVLQNASPLFPFETKTLNAANIIHHISRASGRVSVESSDNAVFNCRVLSRRHASLWTEGGRCFVRDLGSSNGTFVNGQRVDRLQSEGAELFSGDYIQFGEDVDDNYCVRATVRLLPDEIEERESGNQTETPLIPVSGGNGTQLNTHDGPKGGGSTAVDTDSRGGTIVRDSEAHCNGQIMPIRRHYNSYAVRKSSTIALEGRASSEVSDDSQETWQDVTLDQMEEPTEEVLTTPDIDALDGGCAESDGESVVESLRVATSALERRCGVLERIIGALVGHHRKTYSSIVYLGCSVFVLLIGELIRQSVKMERRLVAW